MQKYLNNVRFLEQMFDLSNSMAPFFMFPEKWFHLREYARFQKISGSTAKLHLAFLKKRNFIQSKTQGNLVLFKADSGKLFRKYKMINNISSIIDSKLITFIDETLAPRSIVLFGSYQRGEDIEGSDIDLFIECRKDKLELKEFEKKLGRNIELHFNENFHSYPKELKNNIINGIVLSGFLEGY